MYSSITTVHSISALQTARMFDAAYVEDNESPIDQFIENTNSLNIYFSGSKEIKGDLATLVLLGYMSAVESYLRAILRRVINIDDWARKTVESKEVTFGAAIHHERVLLPEALMENFSFSNPEKVTDALKQFVGIKGATPPELKRPLAEFEKVCQMRHCCVHRFGKLGAKNAIALGLDEHKAVLEKPLQLTNASLAEIAEVLRSFVKSINNHIFAKVLERTFADQNSTEDRFYSEDWTWKYPQDRKRFLRYYNIFASLKDSSPSLPPFDIYDDFRGQCCSQNS